jgi:hypothetical protein
LTTIYDFVKGDILSFDLTLEYGDVVGQIETGGVVYDQSTKNIALRYIAHAPPESFGSGYETAQLNGQILTADSTDSNARTEIAGRTANQLAFINPKMRASVELMDGFWWIIPTLHQRWTFTIAAADTIRGRALTTADYWQLVEMSYTVILDGGVYSREVSATFEEETTKSNAGILVSLIPDPALFSLPTLPPYGAYGAFTIDPLVNYPTDTPTTQLWESNMLVVDEPYPPGYIDIPEISSEILYANMRSGGQVQTTNNTVNGETYVLNISGQGSIGGTTWVQTWDFLATDGGWVTVDWGAVPSFDHVGSYSPGTGWVHSDGTGGTKNQRGVVIGRLITVSTTITSFSMDYEITKGSFDNAALTALSLSYDGGNALQVRSFAATSNGSGTFSWAGSQAISDDVALLNRCHNANAAQSGSVLVTGVTVQGTGQNPFGTTSSSFGDAFYYDYGNTGTATLYAGTNGLVVNGAKPGTIPSFSQGHNYRLEVTGDGNPMTFKFNDGDYTDNDNKNIRISVRGPGMGLS